MISPSKNTVAQSTPPLCHVFPRTWVGLREGLCVHLLIHSLTSSMRVYPKLPALDIVLDPGDPARNQAHQVSFIFQWMWEGKAGGRQITHTWKLGNNEFYREKYSHVRRQGEAGMSRMIKRDSEKGAVWQRSEWWESEEHLGKKQRRWREESAEVLKQKPVWQVGRDKQRGQQPRKEGDPGSGGEGDPSRSRAPGATWVMERLSVHLSERRSHLGRMNGRVDLRVFKKSSCLPCG